MKRLLKLKRLWILLLFPIALLSLYAASVSEKIAEHVFARGVFKVISFVMAHITALLPFSLMEAGIVLLPIVLIALFVWFVVSLIRHRADRGFRAAKAAVNVACVGAIAVFLLVMGCSINYYRHSLASYLDLTIEPASKEELYGLVADLAEEAGRLREQLADQEDASGVYTLSITTKQLGKEAVKAFERLSEQYSIFEGYYPEPKRIFFSRIMSETQLTGIFCPFTMEANVNVDVSDYSIGSTMCHELAHLNGFIREDEANYISYLACKASESVELQYSGVMEALILSGNALARKDSALYTQVRALYSEAVNRDLSANSVYWAQFEDTVVSNTTEKLNDTYLKANNQTDGVQSYGRMVDLLLAEYRKKLAED